MYSRYESVPKRLIECRKEMNLSQIEMSGRFGVSQGYYCKLERGIHTISFEILQLLRKMGGDVYYLISGEKYQIGIVDDYTKKCKSEVEKIEIEKIIIWLINQGIQKEHIICSDLSKLRKYVSYAENRYKEHNIWMNIRRTEELSQEKMAKVMDIDVKRYRRLEKGIILPDADILVALYQKFNYSPLIFLENDLYYSDKLNKIWNMFSEKLQEELKTFLNQAIKLIENKYTKESIIS